MMYTFERHLNENFMPIIRRSDGVEFSLELLVDMKALGFSAEALATYLQSPEASGEPITKVWDDERKTIRFFRSDGVELYAPVKPLELNGRQMNVLTVGVPSDIIGSVLKHLQA